MLEDLVIAVPGDAQSLERFQAKLDQLGLIGWVIDGASLTYPGWLLARVAAGEEEAMLASAGGEISSVPYEELRAALAADWPQVQVGSVVINEVEVHGPTCESSASALHEVAVARRKGLGLDLEAGLEKLALAEVRVGEQAVFARVKPLGDEQELLDVFTTAKGISVVLWRRDPHVVLQVMKRSKPVHLHVWEPSWTPFGATGFDEVRAFLRPAEGDAAQIVKDLGLAQETVVSIRAMMRRASPPLDQLCELLAVPHEAYRVISGECAVEDLPDAVIYQPEKMSKVIRQAIKSSDDDPAWVRWVDEGARELKWWYLAGNAAFLVLCIRGVVSWRDGGSTFWGIAAATGVVATIVDTAVRAFHKRRRRPSAG